MAVATQETEEIPGGISQRNGLKPGHADITLHTPDTTLIDHVSPRGPKYQPTEERSRA